MSLALIIGVDTGVTGAIAALDQWANLIFVEDMPTDRITVGKDKRLRISDVRLLSLLDGIEQAHAFIERPEGRPIPFRDKTTGERKTRQPGAAGMLAFGESFGIARCALTAQKIAVTEVRPGQWKQAIGVPADKDEARRIAAQWYPQWAHMFARKMDDGRAEAVLIAKYGYRQMIAELRGVA